MFEHFGLMDIFAGFKKYKIVIWSVILTFFLTFLYMFFINTLKPHEDSFDSLYVSSGTYYVEPDAYVMQNKDLSVYKSFPNNYLAMLDSDICRKYIFDQLTNKYTKEFISEKTELESKKVDENSMKQLYQANRNLDSMIIEISCITYDKELSKDVRNICHKFLVEVADKNITNSSIKLSGEIDRIIEQNNVKFESTNKNDPRLILKSKSRTKSSVMSLFIKKVIMPTFLIIILCIMAIIILGILSPDMNRMADFAEYDIPIIGEIKKFTKINKNNGE